MTSLWQRRLTWGLVAGFVLLSSLYSVINPLFEAPDEVWHYEYIRWLVEGHALPRPEEFGTAPWRQEGSQPPLYYLLAAALTWPVPTENAAAILRYNPHAAVGEAEGPDNKNIIAHSTKESWPWHGVVLAAHLVRFFSILLGAITVFCTISLAGTLAPRDSAVPLLAGLIIAANPQFLFLSAAVSNDNLVTACCTAGLWLLAELLGKPAVPSTRQIVGLGALVGAAALSKVSGLALVICAALALASLAWRTGKPWPIVTKAAVGGVVALLVAGWWYWRNWQLYRDPFGLAAMFAVLPGRSAPLTLSEVARLIPGIWRSYWAVFGWFNVVVDEWVYQLYTGLALLGLVGLVVAIFAAKGSKRWTPALQAGLLVSWILIIGLLVIRWAQISYPQGRLLFPAASAIATLLALGWSYWWPVRIERWAAVLLSLILVPVALVAPWRWIAPAYRPPALLAAGAPLSHPMQVDFGDQVTLRGYAWRPAELRPGDTFDLTLFWSAKAQLSTDYSIFVHLLDEYDILQAQHDSYPAGGRLATGDWQPGVVVVDPHRLVLPAVLPVPSQLRVEVGVYDFASGARLAPNASTSSANGAWTLGYLPVLPAPAGKAQLLSINFADQIALQDFAFDRWLVPAGEALKVTLHWEALARPAKDYVVFVHLLLPPDAVWAQRDDMPQDGARPTSSWQLGEQIEDSYTLPVPGDAPAGLYIVEIGLYDPESGDRLKVGLSDAGVRLGQLRVIHKDK